MVCWSKIQVNDLIMIYKNQPCLWNLQHKNYKHKTKKDIAWKLLLCDYQAIQDDDAITLEDIKKKIHTLKGQFRQELKYLKQCSISNTDEEEIGPKLWCFRELEFLGNFSEESSSGECSRSSNFLDSEVIKVKEECQEVLLWPGLDDTTLPIPINSSTLSTPVPEESTGGTILIGSDTTRFLPTSENSAPPSITHDILVTANTSREAIPSTLHIKCPRRFKRKRSDASSKEDELLRVAISKLKEEKESDDFTLFGASVGAQLRSIADNNPIQAIIAKKLMNEVLFMGELDKLDLISQISPKNSPNRAAVTSTNIS